MSIFEEEKILSIISFMKTREGLPSLPHHILTNLCSINVYNLISDAVDHFIFFLLPDWTILSGLVITASTASGPLIYVLMWYSGSLMLK